MTYLSNLISELPYDCLFDKGKIGCGGTSLAIESPIPYVICVPFVALIDNKLAQYPNERRSDPLFGFYPGITKKEITDYLASVQVPKILVTYNSLYKVLDYINPRDYNLLIDEYHLLFNQYSFRSDAVRVVLENYTKFNHFTFMTATPLEPEFVLEELKYLPLIKQSWEDVIDIKVDAIKCKSLEASCIKLIQAFLDKEYEGNLYIFVNSLNFIKSVYKKLDLLNAENCRFIYSKSNAAKMPLPNSSVNSEPKKINFLTSTVFEGTDIYDPDGRTVIISDPFKGHTLLDISTSVQQIAGRIRNSKYINQITHLYKTSRYADMTYEEFIAESQHTEQVCKEAVEFMSNANDAVSDLIAGGFRDNEYLRKENGRIIFDPNMVKLDLFAFKLNKGVYTCRVNLANEYKKYNCEIEEGSDYAIKMDFNDTSESFRRIIERYTDHLTDSQKMKYPWLEEAIAIIGTSRMATLNYVQSKIKDEVLKTKDTTVYDKIAYKLSKSISIGNFYSNDELKLKFAKIYTALNICQNPKASDIQNYYRTERKTKRIDGNLTNGYLIYSSNYKF